MDFQLSNVAVCEYYKQIKTKTEVESDVIVPDTKPDISTVLAVKAVADVTERTLRKDKVIFSGNIKFNVLYVGETDKTLLNTIEYTVPFNHQAEMSGADENTPSIGKCNIQKTFYEVKNSRKLSVGALLDLTAEAVRQKDVEVISGDNPSDYPQKCEEIESDFLCGFKEFEFEISDSIPMPAINGECEVYSLSVRPDVSEIKIVNNKAIIKGNANLQILYRIDRELSAFDTETTFTEILDIDSITSDHTVYSHFEICDSNISLSSSENDTVVDVSFKLKGNIASYEHKKLAIVTDIYSPDYSYETVYADSNLCHIHNTVSNQSTVKGSVILDDSMPSVAKVYHMDSFVHCENISTTESAIRLSGTINSIIIYSDDSGNLCKVGHCEPFEFEYPCGPIPQKSRACIDVSCVNYGYALSSSREIQTRIILRTEGIISSLEDVKLITDFSADPKSPIHKASQPSIIVFYPDSQTPIWDIAKKYNTTCEEIIKINSLENTDTVPGNKPILIPKRPSI